MQAWWGMQADLTTTTTRVLEIHRYVGDEFQYVVARTNKHPESYVRADVDKMNSLLSPEMKAQGIRYVFAFGTVEGMGKKTGEAKKKKQQQQQQEQAASSAAAVSTTAAGPAAANG